MLWVMLRHHIALTISGRASVLVAIFWLYTIVLPAYGYPKIGCVIHCN